MKGNKSARNAFEPGSGEMKPSMAEGETVDSPSAGVVQGRGGDAVTPLWERRGVLGLEWRLREEWGRQPHPVPQGSRGMAPGPVAGDVSKLSLLLGVLPSETHFFLPF